MSILTGVVLVVVVELLVLVVFRLVGTWTSGLDMLPMVKDLRRGNARILFSGWLGHTWMLGVGRLSAPGRTVRRDRHPAKKRPGMVELTPVELAALRGKFAAGEYQGHALTQLTAEDVARINELHPPDQPPQEAD